MPQAAEITPKTCSTIATDQLSTERIIPLNESRQEGTGGFMHTPSALNFNSQSAVPAITPLRRRFCHHNKPVKCLGVST